MKFLLVKKNDHNTYFDISIFTIIIFYLRVNVKQSVE